MKTKLIHAIALAVTLALGGCATGRLDPTKSGRDTVIPSGFVLTNIRLSPKLAALEDIPAFTGSSSPVNVQTGKVFRQIFTGGEDATCSLDFISASL